MLQLRTFPSFHPFHFISLRRSGLELEADLHMDILPTALVLIYCTKRYILAPPPVRFYISYWYPPVQHLLGPPLFFRFTFAAWSSHTIMLVGVWRVQTRIAFIIANTAIKLPRFKESPFVASTIYYLHKFI